MPQSSLKKKMIRILLIVLPTAAGLAAYLFFFQRLDLDQTQVETQLASQDLYQSQVRPILNHRCVVCHSCFNAPCQVNLTSYSGLQRGLSKNRVYDAARLQSIKPTRLDIDYHSTEEWRENGFNSIIDLQRPEMGILYRTLLQKQLGTTPSLPLVDYDSTPTLQSHVCPLENEMSQFYKSRALAGMPYNLPAMPPKDYDTIVSWLRLGAPGSDAFQSGLFTAEENRTLGDWQVFLNGTDNRSRLVARYIYEHLFLGHIHFTEASNGFFRLIRSRTTCSAGAQEIPTRRPNDDPKQPFQYCFIPLKQTVVEKTHLPYLMDSQKLQWMRDNFMSTSWQVSSLPDYNSERAANPFTTFEAIPAVSRYRFLLKDAHFHVAGFIKGPVCNGSSAVNSIDEQFYVFFVDPMSDLLSRDSQFYQQSKALLVLPAEKGSDGKVTDLAKYFSKYPPLRNKYRELRKLALQKNFSGGLNLSDLWNGEGVNDQAALTVFRHNDNSYVLRGARGDASRSAFVLDYALFERLVYNLVVGFDVFANLTHQLHTRVYMGMIRMEAETNLLEFMPKNYREQLKEYWYGDGWGKLEKLLIDRKIRIDNATKIELTPGLSSRAVLAQFYDLVLLNRIPHMIQRHPDRINWQSLPSLKDFDEEHTTDIEKILRGISSKNSQSVGNWVKDMPDSSLLVLKSGKTISKVYTLIRNKYVKTVGSILFEKMLRDSESDTITVVEGLATSYPNRFYVVQETDLEYFVRTLRTEDKEVAELLRFKFELRPKRIDFWQEMDSIQDFMISQMGPAGGIIDLTRLEH